jgi:hypothetical protein
MTRFDQFLKERRYLHNVSERSIEWYDQAFNWLPNENPTEAELKQTVIRMREEGLCARSINSYRTALNAYLHWLNSPETKCSPACRHPRIARMKVGRLVGACSLLIGAFTVVSPGLGAMWVLVALRIIRPIRAEMRDACSYRSTGKSDEKPYSW